MRSKHSISRKVFVLFAILSSKKIVGCNPITNSDLKDRIGEFSSKNDSTNSSDMRTMQDESGKYANFSPVHNRIRFKDVDVADSALSSSSYGRGLLHHEHPGYTLHEYEEIAPAYGYEYHAHGPAHHGFDHHTPDHHHEHGGHHDVYYHHKHYDHALAAKAFLWPLAGIALLGAAAALVSNPVLLQLGAVSGRRKRRDTEEIYDTQLDTGLSWLKSVNVGQIHEDSKVMRFTKNSERKQADEVNFKYRGKFRDNKSKRRGPVKNYVEQEALFKELLEHPTVQSPVELAGDNPRRFSDNYHLNKNNLLPVPLLLKEKV